MGLLISYAEVFHDTSEFLMALFARICRGFTRETISTKAKYRKKCSSIKKCLVYIELRRKEDLPDQHLWFTLQQPDGNLSDQRLLEKCELVHYSHVRGTILPARDNSISPEPEVQAAAYDLVRTRCQDIF